MARPLTVGFNAVIINSLHPGNRLKKARSANIYAETQNLRKADAFLQNWRHMAQEDQSKFLTLRKECDVWFSVLLPKGIMAISIRNTDPWSIALTLFSVMSRTYSRHQPGAGLTRGFWTQEVRAIPVQGILSRNQLVNN